MNLISFIVVLVLPGCLSSVPRPRGVSISMASFYKQADKFRCLDGSKEFPFEYINDDYCDCPDGSDEPGTSACSNGKFHCTNAGYKPTNIQSSRVNDGVCDCCDGTDEWAGSIQCVNNCKELGKKMREEADRIQQLQEEGYKTKLRYIEEGKKRRDEKTVELAELEKTKTELEALKSEMEIKKNQAEEPEKEAKQTHENAWNEELERRKAEKQKFKAEIAFSDLDANGDKLVDVAELKSNSVFDIDSNGEVSEEEAKEHLEGQVTADFDHFVLKVWPNIKDLYRPKESEDAEAKGDNAEEAVKKPENSDQPKLIFKGASPVDDEETFTDEEEDYDDDDEEEELDERELNSASPNTETKEDEEEEEAKMPDYDEATKLLMAAADEARKQFTDAESNLSQTENKIRDLNSYLSLDLGPNNEYSELKGNCYEYTDREYTYKLCAFDKTSQRPKNGGSETSLGKWGRWDGSAEDKYAAMLYDNGQNCWNGPNRSVKVNMKCGLENQVTNAFEPSRCEYEFDFETPSRCSEPPKTTDHPAHTEL